MRVRAILFLTAGLECFLLSSCFIVRVPLNVTSAVVVGTAKAGSKAASATKDAFTKSDEEKEEEEKKKELKEAAKKKKEGQTTQPQTTPQLGPDGQPMQGYETGPVPPPADAGGYYKPSITPDMLPKMQKNGAPIQEVRPTPVQQGF